MFLSREEAGVLLAQKFIQAKLQADLVIGLPRGGVAIAYEIGKYLKIPIDVLMVKKIGAPHQLELAIGAVTKDQISYLNHDLIEQLNISQDYIQKENTRISKDLSEKENIFRFNRTKLNIFNKNIILTDDGVATGATIFAGLKWLKIQKPKSIVLLLPVAPYDLQQKLQNEVDKCIILEISSDFRTVGEFYQDFREVSDEEVIKILLAVSRQSSDVRNKLSDS